VGKTRPQPAHGGIGYCDRAIFISESNSLVIADLHLGRGMDDAISFPIDSHQDDTSRLTSLLNTFTPTEVVIAGDILHAFSAIPAAVKAQLAKLERTILNTGADLIYVRGNHDVVLDNLTDITVTATYRPDSADILITHGHESLNDSAGTVLMGHEHPALNIEGRKYPCFLEGPGPDAIEMILILPSFSMLTQGTIVNSATPGPVDSPIVTDIEEFSPIVYTPDTDEVFRFPPLSDLTSAFPP
jgi:putative SbcD/Mre11-related phosphoesterase